jgi:predicted RNA-binding Zn-ribbon protein involved in translation (DUF1610 family)
MDLDYFAVVYHLDRIDKTWIINARCETCRADVQHGGQVFETPDLGARVPHCRCPFPAYVLILPSLAHPIPEAATKAELASNAPLTAEERRAVAYACPGCGVDARVPCNSTGSRWRTCPARLARLLRIS